MEADPADVVGAIRLALIGASDDATAVKVVEMLCEKAPATDGQRHEPVELLVAVIHELKGRLAVP